MKASVTTLLLLIGLTVSLTACAGSRSANSSDALKTCAQNGWQQVEFSVAGHKRAYFWKGPPGAWSKGTIIVMHGGGGSHHQFCALAGPLTNAQVRFTDMAVQRGFGVLVLNSTDKITDSEGRLCGKIWDDEVRNRPNIDLPFIRAVITEHIPKLRGGNGASAVFLTGLSSGGYMTVRAATELSSLVTAFAPVSNGDPYGWHRVCVPKPGGRQDVHGAGYDNDTGKEIIEQGSCAAVSGYKNEAPWPQAAAGQKPVFKIFHHRQDGVNDFSCNERVRSQLLAHGYPEEERFALDSGGRRRLVNHFWLDDYNAPILDFFARHAAP
jgi:poly(3-hydroxybutyrate) depolymerase